MMDKSRYPSNWDEISRRIRYERASGKCEQCGAPDHEYIRRNRGNPAMWEPALEDDSATDEWFASIKVVLTVHHIGTTRPDGTPGDSHDKMDVRVENLIALCQRCHLLADLEIHKTNARSTRIQKRQQEANEAGQMELF